MLLYNTSLFLLFTDVINRNQKISCLIMFKDIITACSENHVRLRNALKAKTVPQHATKERKYSSYSFSTSALDGVGWSASRPGRTLAPGKGPPGNHCTGGWVCSRAGLDTEATGKILCLCRESNLERPVVQPVARHYTD
jgi:hypothetical protein